jgi:hypothetical protein
VGLSVGELAVELEAKTQAFGQRLTAAERRLSSFEKRAQTTTAAAGASFTRLRGSVAGLATGFGAIVAALGVGGVTRAARAAAEELDRIGETADRLGLTTDALQELQFAASGAGVSNEGLASALQFLSRQIGNARTGSGALATILKRTNPELLQQLTTTTDLERQFGLMTRAISGAANQQDALALSAAGFGRGAGAQLATVALTGADAFDRLRERAREAGVVFDEAIVRDAGAAADELELLSRILKANLQRALLSSTPLLVSFSGALAEAAQGAAFFFDVFRDLGSRSTKTVEVQLGMAIERVEDLEVALRKARKEAEGKGPSLLERLGLSTGAPGSGIQRELEAARQEVATLQAELSRREAGALARRPKGGIDDAAPVDFEARERARKEAEEAEKRSAEERVRNAERLVDLERQLRIERLEQEEPLRAQIQAIDDQIEDLEKLNLDEAGRAKANELTRDLKQQQADLEQRISDARFTEKESLDALKGPLGVLAELDAERARDIKAQTAARLAEATGVEERADILRAGGAAAEAAAEDAKEDLELDVGEAVGQGFASGIRGALKDAARGELPEFADVLQELSTSALDTAIDTMTKGLEKALEGIFDQLADALGASGERFQGAIAGALGVGLGLAAGALRDTDVDVRREAIRSAVTDTRELRGVVAGPTDVPIFQVGESIEQGFVPVAQLLTVTNTILRGILTAVQEDTGAGGVTSSIKAMVEAAAAELAATTSPSLS